MPKHIGIVAVSPEGSAVCYRLIGRRASEIENPERRPLVTLHNRPLSSYVEALRRNDWGAIGEMLCASARVLADVGCDFCVLPDNVTHHALPLAEANSPIPWVNMIDLVADAVKANGCRNVGLIGTRIMTFGSTYQTALGLRGMKLLVPDEPDVNIVDSIIFNEAIYGHVCVESSRRVSSIVHGLGQQGCDAVILGSSEASIMLKVEDSPLPLFDPVELLAEAAVNRALS